MNSGTPIDHDRLFKELLTEFFADFLVLFLPDVRAYVAPDSLEFLDKEVFTDVTAGERHEADLVVKARFRDRPAFFLVHVENQSTAQADFGKRMFRDFARLSEAHDLPVHPVVLFSYDRPRRAEPTEYRVAFPDQTVLEFRYRVIQLNRLDWRGFVNRPNPVASALMAKMQIAPRAAPASSRSACACLRPCAWTRPRHSSSRASSTPNLRLSAREQKLFEQEVAAFAPPERKEVVELITSWEEKGLQRGLEQGERLGASATTLRVLRRRFGPLPEALETQVASLPKATLDDLAEALFDRIQPAASTQALAGR